MSASVIQRFPPWQELERAVPTSLEGRSLTMLGYLEHVTTNLFVAAMIFRILLTGIAELVRLYLGRRAIDKAQQGELPAVMDALARWRQGRKR